jgi:hypothetical protein
MHAPSSRVTPPTPKQGECPVTLFKNSLRDWRARYQAGRTAQPGSAKKRPSQTPPV